MRAVVTLSTVLALFICQGRIATQSLSCSNDTTDLATRVQGSSTVVYGKIHSKGLNEGGEATIHVMFNVDCILKGPATARMINITEAGPMENRRHCQTFPLVRTPMIVFLDRLENSTNFTTSDFAEMLYQGNTTDHLLANTCDLHQVLPLGSTAETCPAVSTDARCISIVNSTATMTVVLEGASIDVVRGKSATVQVDVDRNGGMISSSLNLALILLSNLVLRWN